jgi:hypothetical protein
MTLALYSSPATLAGAAIGFGLVIGLSADIIGQFMRQILVLARKALS